LFDRVLGPEGGRWRHEIGLVRPQSACLALMQFYERGKQDSKPDALRECVVVLSDLLCGGD
jgi:hypothetical protein